VVESKQDAGVRVMYTGTLIDELMATVERAEQGTREREAVTEEVERWFSQSDFAHLEQTYQGVA
jgi:hypothetical protein